MITCKQATEFVLKREEVKLSLKQLLQLYAHLAICKFCRSFYKQNDLINKALKKEQPSFQPLSATEKEQLLQQILSQSGG